MEEMIMKHDFKFKVVGFGFLVIAATIFVERIGQVYIDNNLDKRLRLQRELINYRGEQIKAIDERVAYIFEKMSDTPFMEEYKA